MITPMASRFRTEQNAKRLIFTLSRIGASRNSNRSYDTYLSFNCRQSMENMGCSQYLKRNKGITLSAASSPYRKISSHRGFTTAPEIINNKGGSEGVTQEENSDHLLVVGSGVAGCSAALIAAQTYRIPVTLICAGSQLADCNSYWAQGGIIYRNYDSSVKDTASSLCEDIHRAGAGLCKDEAVRKLADEGPDRVRELLLDDKTGIFANVPFDRNEDGELLYCLEASHSAPRIVHYADESGKAITEHITKAAARHPLISVRSDSIVTDLMISDASGSCIGVDIMHNGSGRMQSLFTARGVVLASGGLGGIYEHTTNPKGFNALGSSVALALRAGASTSDLEYVQFHPTALTLPGESKFLLTEALRGEGALLRDAKGRAFAKDFHPDGELAPRDVVSRGVYNKLKSSPVYLDITHRDATWLDGRFPSIQNHLKKRGLSLAHDRLPISPASHYTCGGITVDKNGLTSVSGLYAAGEAACTGLHGGNRLASTSLLEGLVWGASVADHVGKIGYAANSGDILHNAEDKNAKCHSLHNSKLDNPEYIKKSRTNSEETEVLLSKLRQIMWEKVGVVRSPSVTAEAKEDLNDLKQKSITLFEETPTAATVGLRDASFAGEAVAHAAHFNRESKGAHCIIEDEDVESNEMMVS